MEDIIYYLSSFYTVQIVNWYLLSIVYFYYVNYCISMDDVHWLASA